MKIIPVIDILDGKVVHGIQGRRESYKPIKPVLTDSCQGWTKIGTAPIFF